MEAANGHGTPPEAMDVPLEVVEAEDDAIRAMNPHEAARLQVMIFIILAITNNSACQAFCMHLMRC